MDLTRSEKAKGFDIGNAVLFASDIETLELTHG